MIAELLNQKSFAKEFVETFSNILNGQVSLPGFGANSLHSFISPKSLVKVEPKNMAKPNAILNPIQMHPENEVLDQFLLEGMKLFNQGVYSKNLVEKKSDLGIYL
ncbi:MAG: hypothetical protein K9H61_14505 [Bacteroidia bacterium]|nr:hypothetical protein [Bacteroidia bacterium]MCF8448199.1 hypothetical protein [Bacteroidia bacterium]